MSRSTGNNPIIQNQTGGNTSMAITRKAAPAAARGRGSAPAARPASTGGKNGGKGGTVSLRPSDQQQGGLLDDVDVTLKSLTFCEWDYNGAISDPVLAICVEMETDDGQEVEPQYFSCGDLKRMNPTADGKGLDGASRGLNQSSNGGVFLKSIVDAGFPEDRIENTLSTFENTNVHVNRIPQKQRAGFTVTKKNDQYQATVLVVTGINRLPWEKEGTKTAARPVTGAAGRAPVQPTQQSEDTEANLDVVDEAMSILTSAIDANGGKLPMNRIAMKTLKALAGNPNANEIRALFQNTDFLNGIDGVDFDGTTLSTS